MHVIDERNALEMGRDFDVLKIFFAFHYAAHRNSVRDGEHRLRTGADPGLDYNTVIFFETTVAFDIRGHARD